MIRFTDYSFTYTDASSPALRDVNVEVAEGDLVLAMGRTGTGKSTLLRSVNGLVPHFTGGRMQGQVQVAGRCTREQQPRDLADVVGFVGQDPLAGFVTDTVEDELAYGMEQLAVAPTAMRKRVEETLDLLGIAELRGRPLSALSGGQQQRVAIGSVLTAHPRVLVLDEPTSALDPTAAQDVLATLTSLVHDVGMTVLVAEHRLERVMHEADRVLWVRGDAAVDEGAPEDVLARADVVPPLAALARQLGWDQVPLSVRSARRDLRGATFEVNDPSADAPTPGDALVEAKGVKVSYGAVRAVDGVDLTLHAGTVTALMGRNGAGKSTLLWALQGSTKRDSGSVRVATAKGPVDPSTLDPARARAAVCLVPQSAGDLLYLTSVGAELAQADAETGAEPGTAAALLERLGADLPHDRDPRDLSEGQRLALVLAIQLVAGADVILLDEPTRGLDYAMKGQLRRILRGLAAEGAAVVVSTHDVEFAAAATDRTVIMADGQVVADGPTREVCTASPAFAPQIAKVCAPQKVLVADDIRAVGARRTP